MLTWTIYVISLQVDFSKWAEIESERFPEFDQSYLSSILGDDILMTLTEKCEDETSKVKSVIEYFTGRHCLFYSWFCSSKSWYDSIRKFNELEIQTKIKERLSTADHEYWYDLLQSCVLKICRTSTTAPTKLSGDLASLYAYITCDKYGQVHFDVASEYIRDIIRCNLRYHVKLPNKKAIDLRLNYIIQSLENESHSTNFGYTMEDGVRLILQTNKSKLWELLCSASTTIKMKGISNVGCIVSDFYEQSSSLSIYWDCSAPDMQLLLPISDKNNWIDAILLYNIDIKKSVQVVGIQITTSSLQSAKINKKTERFMDWMQHQNLSGCTISTTVFYICKDNTTNAAPWWSFAMIHPKLGELAVRGPCRAAASARNGMCNLLLCSITKSRSAQT